MVFDHIGFKVTAEGEGEGWAMIGRTGEGPALVRLVRRLPGPDPHCLCRQDAG